MTALNLDRERSRRPWLLVLGAGGLLALWSAWFVLGEVRIYVRSQSARLELAGSTYRVQSPIEGRVSASALEIGRVLRAGSVLVELDVHSVRLTLEEARARRAMLRGQIEALLPEIATEQRVGAATEQARDAMRAEAAAREAQEEALAHQARTELQQLTDLYARKLISAAEYERARSNAHARSAAARAAGARRKERDYGTELAKGTAQIRLERARQTLAELEGELAVVQVKIRRLEHEIDLHSIRAPVSGRIASAAVLQAGAVLKVGDSIASIAPEGELRVRASFDPARSVGKLRAGQMAQFRADAFPWTQYGPLLARVARVSSEHRDGSIWVELVLEDRQIARIPLVHGLAGLVDVLVEETSPLNLLVRTVGMRSGDDAAAAPRTDRHPS